MSGVARIKVECSHPAGGADVAFSRDARGWWRLEAGGKGDISQTVYPPGTDELAMLEGVVPREKYVIRCPSCGIEVRLNPEPLDGALNVIAQGLEELTIQGAAIDACVSLKYLQARYTYALK